MVFKNQKCDLAIVVSDLGSGGAQKAITTIANALSLTGVKITLITFASEKNDFFILNESIQRISLELYGVSSSFMDAIYSNVMRIVALRRAIKSLSPDTVISLIGITNILTILSMVGLKNRLIISERSNPAIEYLGKPWQLFRILFYRFADVVTANSLGAINKMEEYVPKNKLKFLPNPVLFIDKDNVCKNNNRENIILGVGSLRYEKGFDILLESFSRIHDKIPDWKLIILGDGGLKADLQKQTELLGIEDKVILAGRVDEPANYYQRATVFALPSRREGMPNALLEAIAFNIPVVVSDSSPGPLEIVINQETGLVVSSDNYEALSQALLKLTSDKNLRKELSSKAAEKISDYDLDKVIPVWKSVIRI